MESHSTQPLSLAAMRTWQSGMLQMAVHRITKRYSDEYLQQYDLTTMQWLIIGTVLETGDEGIRVTDLAEKAGTTLSYMTTTLNKLEDREILRRIKTGDDSRTRLMIVCREYRLTCSLIEEGLRDVFRDNIYRKVTRPELEQYIKTLQALARDD